MTKEIHKDKIPRTIEEMVEYIVQNSPSYQTSEYYMSDLGGNYNEYRDLGTIIGNSYGNYIGYLMTLYTQRPADVAELKYVEANIIGDFEVLEALSSSDSEAVLTAVATGIFEAMVDVESEVTVGAIVANLGPYTRKLWNEHIPGFTGIQFKENNKFRILSWDKN